MKSNHDAPGSMTAIDRLHQAEAAAREAEAARQDAYKAAYKAAYKSGDKAEIAAAHARCANTQANLLAALDAARGEAVWQVSLSKNPECWSDYDYETTANAVAKASGNKCREVRAVFLAPPAALAVPAPSAEDAQRMGQQGGPVVESERLAFEAWMRGHCWALGAVWNGKGYIGMNEEDGFVCPQATRTRGLWAAWRDRAALAQQPAALAVPEGYVPLAAAEALALEAMRVGNLGGHERTVEGHWSAEVGDRFEEFMFEEGFAMLAAPVQQPAAAVPEGTEAGNDVFTLLRECRTAIRQLGWRGNNYNLNHEGRTLAIRFERGDFEAAMRWVKSRTQAPPAAAVPAEAVIDSPEVLSIMDQRAEVEAYVRGWNACRAAMLAAANKESTNG